MLTYRSKFFGGGTSGGSGPITVTGPIQATTVRAVAPATVTITNATNATPIIVTAVAHGLLTGDAISISGTTGNTNANGYFKITRLTADTFSLQNYSTGADIAGNGAYGGAPVAVTGIVQAQRVLVGDGTAAAPSVAFASAPNHGFYTEFSTIAWANAGIKRGALSGYNINLTTDLGTLIFGASGDAIISRAAAATLQLGAANSATGAGVAQTLQVQSNITETDKNSPGDWTLIGARGTGTGTPGKILFQVGTKQNSSGTAHVPATALTLQNAGTGGTAAPQALFADGTAAAPSVAFASAPGEGFYSIDVATIGLATGGTQRFQFAGNTGILRNVNDSGSYTIGASSDLIISRGAAATLQLGAANAASPVGQRLRSQGAATGTDIAGADLNISPGPMTGTGANYAAGRYGALRLGTYVPGTTGTTTSTTTTDRLVIPGRPIVLTAGSGTNIVHIDIPALAGASWDIAYSVKVTDSAAPVQMKVLGGRYYGSAYRLAAGNAVPNAVVETGDNEVHSVGNAATDVMTFTGDATGVMVAHNITVGTGLTAPNTLVGSYMVTVSGAAAITVTPQ